MKHKQGNWGIGGGINFGGDVEFGMGLNVSYGSGGWNFGLAGYYNPPDEVYTSSISDNLYKRYCLILKISDQVDCNNFKIIS